MTLNIWGYFVGLPRHASHKFFQPSGIISLTLLLYPWGKWGRKRREKYHLLGTAMEKVMAPHSSTLAWKVPRMEEPGGLQSLGLRRVGHDWATSLSLFTFTHWRTKCQPTPVFLPGESQGWGAWWAAVYGITQSQTRLKWLSSRSRYLLWARSFLIIWIFLIIKWHWFWNHILGEN